jgi:hypothetical protein
MPRENESRHRRDRDESTLLKDSGVTLNHSDLAREHLLAHFLACVRDAPPRHHSVPLLSSDPADVAVGGSQARSSAVTIRTVSCPLDDDRGDKDAEW